MNTPITSIIAKKLKAFRKEKGMSEEEVADHLGISQSTYSRIENSESNSWASHIKSICELLDVQPEKLVKQDAVLINNDQQNGEISSGIKINQLSEKLVEQYETRIKEKDKLIEELKQKLVELQKS